MTVKESLSNVKEMPNLISKYHDVLRGTVCTGQKLPVLIRGILCITIVDDERCTI
jgi:hypothetical protein